MTDAKELAERIAWAINQRWNEIKDVPFPLYRGEAEELAEAAIAAIPPANIGDERAKLREVLKQIANFGEEKDEWDAVNRYEIVRNLAHGVLAETDPSRPVITGGE